MDEYWRTKYISRFNKNRLIIYTYTVLNPKFFKAISARKGVYNNVSELYVCSKILSAKYIISFKSLGSRYNRIVCKKIGIYFMINETKQLLQIFNG